LWLLIYAKVAFSRSAVGGTLRLLSMPVESSSKTYSERSCIFVFQKYFIKIGEARISYLCFAILKTICLQALSLTVKPKLTLDLCLCVLAVQEATAEDSTQAAGRRQKT